ncbi:ATP-binding protein [soil metagenome]
MASRVALASVVIVMVGLAGVALAAPLVAREHDMDALAARLASEAAIAGELAREDLAARDGDRLDALARRIAAASGTRVTLVGRDGTVLGESDQDRRVMDDHRSRPEVAAALRGERGTAARPSETLGRDLLYVAVPVRQGDAIVGVARTALPLAAVDPLAARLSQVILAAAAAAALAALVVALLLARAVTRPLTVLSERAERSSAGQQTDFAVAGPREIEQLAGALRRMSDAFAAEHLSATRERDRLATLLDELGDAIVIAAPDDRVVLANASAARAFGASSLGGRRLAEVVREHEVIEAVERARRGESVALEVERSNPQRWLRVIARRIEAGQVLLVLQDLSALRRLETVRRDFVANVSHELRTPIASLKAMVETLEAGALDDPPAARDFVARMQAEIDGLAQLVNELLALSRAESGREALSFGASSPADLLAAAARRMAPLAERACVTLEVAAPGALPAVRADAAKIGEVVGNLVPNAAKFTKSGGRVTLAAEPRDGSVAFTVRDTGMGIAAADLDRVFERFYKGDEARAGGGMGLGLAIATHLVRAHGGEMSVASEGPGRGAAFTFTLPAAR